MRRGTIVLFVFLVIIAAVLGLSQFLRTQPPLELQVAVSPMAQDWIAAALERYNATSPVLNTQRVRFIAVPVEDLDVWNNTNAAAAWTAQSHPVAWIPAWSPSVSYASGMPFTEVSPSLAKTLLVWGALTSRVTALTDGSTPLDWDRVAAAAAQINWNTINPQAQGVNGNFTMAYNRPNTRISGLAVLLDAGAAFNQTPTVDGRQLAAQDFRNWLQPVLESVPNFATLGASPAMTLASRGASVGDVALLPENDWLKNLNGTFANTRDPILLSYPQYPFVFDFPMVMWSAAPAEGSLYTRAQLEVAVNALGGYLTGAAEQTAAQSFGLRPADGSVPAGSLFIAGQAYGAQPAFDFGTSGSQPSLSDIQRLITWANTYVR